MVIADGLDQLLFRHLGEAGQDLLSLAIQFRDTAACDLASYCLLERVLGDQFAVDDAAEGHDAPIALVRKPEDVPCDTVANPADPDASYNAHHGLGYMAQVVESFCEDDGDHGEGSPSPDLITHVAVHKMTVHDGHRLPDALEDLASRAIMPRSLLADSHYGAEDNQVLAKAQGIDLVAPARSAKGKAAVVVEGDAVVRRGEALKPREAVISMGHQLVLGIQDRGQVVAAVVGQGPP